MTESSDSEARGGMLPVPRDLCRHRLEPPLSSRDGEPRLFLPASSRSGSDVRGGLPEDLHRVQA